MRTLISWWLFVKLTINCIVNNSASTMSVLLCTAPTSWMRRRQRLVCASASSMALLLTPTQLVIWNYTNYWQCLATARCQGTLSRLNCLTLDDWLGIPRKTTATAFEVVCEWYVSPGWRADGALLWAIMIFETLQTVATMATRETSSPQDT